MKPLGFLLGICAPLLTVSTIVSDTGCYCALKKNNITTPTSNTSIPVGCSYKTDWNGAVSKYCLTDQTTASCGTNQPGFGIVDSCAIAGFTSIVVSPPVILDWSQGNRTFYTGQTLSVNWTSQNILPDENLTISTTRTLSPALGVPSALGFYQTRISDSGTSVTSGAPVVFQTVSSPQVNFSSPAIAIIQSRIANLVLYNNMTIMSTGNSVVCDGRNITVSWQGIGEASVGTSSVTIRSTGGGGGGGGGGTTVGTALTGLSTRANMTVYYSCPRGQNIPGFGNTFAAYISVQSPGVGVAPYTLTSPTTFSLVAAATPTPTGTGTTTPSPTPTASLSTGSTASNTASNTQTPTSTGTPSATVTGSATPTLSITSSASITASSTKTPAASIDLAAIAAKAQSASMNALGEVLGGIFGAIGAICLSGFGYYIYQRRQIRVRRLKRNEISRKRFEEIPVQQQRQEQRRQMHPNHVQTVIMYQQGPTHR